MLMTMNIIIQKVTTFNDAEKIVKNKTSTKAKGLNVENTKDLDTFMLNAKLSKEIKKKL